MEKEKLNTEEEEYIEREEYRDVLSRTPEEPHICGVNSNVRFIGFWEAFFDTSSSEFKNLTYSFARGTPITFFRSKDFLGLPDVKVIVKSKQQVKLKSNHNKHWAKFTLEIEKNRILVETTGNPPFDLFYLDAIENDKNKTVIIKPPWPCRASKRVGEGTCRAHSPDKFQFVIPKSSRFFSTKKERRFVRNFYNDRLDKIMNTHFTAGSLSLLQKIAMFCVDENDRDSYEKVLALKGLKTKIDEPNAYELLLIQVAKILLASDKSFTIWNKKNNEKIRNGEDPALPPIDIFIKANRELRDTFKDLGLIKKPKPKFKIQDLPKVISV